MFLWRSFFKTNLQKRQIEFPYENGFIEFCKMFERHFGKTNLFLEILG